MFLKYDPHNPSTTLPQLDVQLTLPAGNRTWQSCFLMLPPTGQLLCGTQTNQLFMYAPDPAGSRPRHDWRPLHIEVTECMVPDHSYRLSGVRVNGLSQAVCYGDDAGNGNQLPNRASDERRSLSSLPGEVLPALNTCAWNRSADSVELARIVAHHLARFVFGHIREVLADAFNRKRKGALGMRIIRTPHQMI
jgi:hypothetical protein